MFACRFRILFGRGTVAVFLDAFAKELEAVPLEFKTVLLANLAKFVVYFRALKLEDIAAFLADDMVMCPVTIAAFVVQVLVPKTVLFNKVAFYQKIERVIDGCAGNIVPFLLEIQENLVGIEMVGRRVNFTKHQHPLGRAAMTFLLEIVLKKPLDRIDNIFSTLFSQ